MKKRVLALAFAIISLVSAAQAQQAEVTITLNEQFFDVLLDAIFKNTTPPEFPISANGRELKGENRNLFVSGFAEDLKPKTEVRPAVCNEVIRLKRENEGVRTSVRFRDGKIFAPIAFVGSYNPPLIGCVDFSGVAETNIELEFDRQRQMLVGRATVSGVNLSGTGGLGSGILARMVQSSIDKKINPIQILQMEKVSFVVPIQNSGSLRMKAVGVRHEIASGALNVRIAYEFQKAD
ncbi:MAG: hypothetical protein M3384_04225 [Acidobacteriota bacterium]|nr:hypothetical protein [Acidobacteriota bacterium]